MARARLISLAIALAVSCSVSVAPLASEAKQTKKSSKVAVRVNSDKEAAVRAWVGEFTKAINNADAAAVASFWTTAGHYTDETGSRYAGRQNIEKVLRDVYAGGKPSVELIVEGLQFPGPNFAIVEGTVRHKNGAVANRYAMTLVQDGGKWLITSATETPVIAVAAPTPRGSLNELAWLIGDWRSTNSKGSVRMNADWTANKNFVLCKFEVANGKDVRTETQVIGWDPILRRPRSWMFDGGGGFADGIWNRNAGAWSVDSRTVLPDGGIMTSRTVLSDVKPDSFKWQSVDRRWNGTLVENTAPLTVERVKK